LVLGWGTSNFRKGLEDTLESLDIGTELNFVLCNHDAVDELKWICIEHESFFYFHADHVTIGGRIYAGLGGGLPGILFSVTEEKRQQILRQYYFLDNLVLCTHTPPYAMNVDVTLDGSNIGYHRL